MQLTPKKFLRHFHPKSKGTSPLLSSLNSKYKRDLPPWARDDGKGKENSCYNRTDWLVSHEGAAPNAARALCRRVGELVPIRRSSSSWRKWPLGHNSAITRTPLFHPGQGEERINLSLPFLMFENLLNPLCHDYRLLHSPPNLETATGISALRSPLVCKGSRAVVQTHLLHGFGVEKSACGACAEIQVVLLWLHLGVLALYCWLAS